MSRRFYSNTDEGNRLLLGIGTRREGNTDSDMGSPSHLSPRAYMLAGIKSLCHHLPPPPIKMAAKHLLY